MSEFAHVSPAADRFTLAIHIARLLELATTQALEEERLATHDPLTGALNREGLARFLEIAEAPKAMLLVDNTNFKEVNTRFGYAEGDRVICDTYKVLQSSVRPSDVIVRWGGDEWVVVLNDDNQTPELSSLNSGERRIESTQLQHIDPVVGRIAQVTEGYLIGRPDLQGINFNLAVGSVVWDGESDVEDLIRKAERPMKDHKSQQHKLGNHRAA